MIVLILLSQNAVFGNTITASSASASDVQLAINSANDGDTVIVPAGNVTWSSAVTINKKAITLQGSGMASTIITSGMNNASDLVITPPTNGKWVTVSGFHFIDSVNGAVSSVGMIHISGDGYWRLCSNYISLGYTGVTQWGNGGLFDHNRVEATFGAGGNPTGFYHNGNNSIWSTTIQYGTTTNWTYIEHNTFYWDPGRQGANGADDGCFGAATCFRYNAVTNTWIGMHGVDTTGPTACSNFGEEYYGNTFYNAIGGNIDIAMGTRGGTGIFWGNTLGGAPQNNYNSIVKLMDYRWEGTQLGGWPPFPASIDGWLITSGTYKGWPAYQQPGYTGPIQGVDLNTGKNINGFTNCIEVSSPVYVWSNQVVGVSANTTVAADGIIFQNTNYFVGVVRPGYVPLVDPYPLGALSQPATNPPQITAQPINATVTAGQTATFNVAALGSGTLTYQWYWYGTNVIGASSSSWTTPGTVIGNSNSLVYVTVGNAYGSVTSSIAHLYVTSGVAPAIITNPASQTIAAGGSAVFTVSASGTTPMAYQWQFNSAAIAGATNSSYILAPVGTNNAGGYRASVINNYGSVTSAVATLTVTASTQTVHYYYVAPNGNDANNGSIGSPWATVNHATASMVGGDVLYIRGGKYGQIFDIYGPSGSATYPTIVQAYPGETPIFNYNNITSSGHSLDGLNWFILSGLTIMSNNVGLYVGAAGACRNVVLTNLTIANTGQQGLQIYNQSQNILVINDTIHDTGLWNLNGEGIYIGVGDQSPADNTHNVTVQGCTIYNTSDEGIELKPGTYNMSVISNVLHHCNLPQNPYGAGGGAIEVDEEGTYNYWPNNPNQIVQGNTVYDTVIGIRCATGVTCYNNVVYGCSSYGILVNNTTGQSANLNYSRLVYNNTVDNSPAIVYNSGAASFLNNIGYSGAYNLADNSAYFVNATAHNYHLVPGSAPIQAGNNLSSVVTTDFDGNARPISGAFDIGAYQYGAAGALLPPANLHIVSSQ